MPRDNDREELRTRRSRDYDDDWDEDEDDRPRRRRRKSRSRTGLWIGLGVGGVVLVGLMVTLLVILLSGSKGTSETQKKLVGKWERVGGGVPVLQLLEFTDTGIFRQGHPATGTQQEWLVEFGSYQVSGSKVTIQISRTSTISINGQRIQELEAELLSDDELQLKYLATVDKYRRVKR